MRRRWGGGGALKHARAGNAGSAGLTSSQLKKGWNHRWTEFHWPWTNFVKQLRNFADENTCFGSGKGPWYKSERLAMPNRHRDR